MTVLRLQALGGSIPVSGDRALPDGFAAESLNSWLYGNELRGVRPPSNLQTVNNITQKVFRIPKGTVGGDPAFPSMVPPPSYLGDSVWAQFTDPDTDIVRGPLIGDSYQRFYMCSPTTGPMYNTYARLLVGSSWYLLGVNAPTTAAGLVVTGGAAVSNVTRAYVYTWVTQYGEESGPSPPVVVAGKPDGSWDLTAMVDPTAPEIAGRANIVSKNIYRTITAASGVTTYFFVANIALGVTIYSDTLPDTTVASQLALSTVNYSKPPADLQGIIAMPNGFLIGWKGSDIYFSEPYQPHAWPVEYVVSTEYPIVGMGVYGQTCVVCTQGFPATISGVRPVSTSLTKGNVNEPCLSRGSIVSSIDGVMYASQNGLISVSAAGIANATQKLITSEDWIKDFAPNYLRAARYQNGYLALRAVPDTNARSGFFLDPTALQVALTEFSELDTGVNIFSDIWSGEVFLIDKDGSNNQVKRWNPPTSDLWPVLWRSKEFTLPYEQNFGCYAVFWDEARYAGNTFGTDIIANGTRVRFRVWCDRVLIYDQTVPYNGKPARLPSDRKGLIWQFEVRARAPVYTIHAATSMSEIRAV